MQTELRGKTVAQAKLVFNIIDKTGIEFDASRFSNEERAR